MVLQIILADSLLVARLFPRPCGARKNTTQLVKYPRVLSVKSSNKVYLFQISKTNWNHYNVHDFFQCPPRCHNKVNIPFFFLSCLYIAIILIQFNIFRTTRRGVNVQTVHQTFPTPARKQVPRVVFLGVISTFEFAIL